MKATLLVILSSLAFLIPHQTPTPREGGVLPYLKPIATAKTLPETTQAPVESVSKIVVVPPTPAPKPAYVAPSGSCTDWLAQAGIPITYGVMELINSESGCNPYSVNKDSGACGIPQNINGCSTFDPIQQLLWMDNYVKARYISWANAYNTWLSRYPHWY